MTRRRRLWLVLFLGIAITAIALLAASLPQLQLLPGRPFYLGGPLEASPTPEASAGADASAALAIALNLLVWIGTPLLLFSIVWAIVRKKREYLITLLIVVAWAALILYVQIKVVSSPEALWSNSAETTPEEEGETPEPTDVFEPHVPEWLVYAASAGLALLLLVMVRALWQGVRPRPQAVDYLAQEAQRAVEEMNAGAAWQEVVRRCYAEMCQRLKVARGYAREESMTPHEFAAHLEKAGLPIEHIQRLTRLFERVRYGGKDAGPEEQEEAIACLSAVAALCRREA
jgi:hypothetical protein